MKKLKILIPIFSSRKAFLVGFGTVLSSHGHTIYYMSRDSDVKKVINNLMPELDDGFIDVKSDFEPPQENDVIRECLKREKKYGMSFAMIASYDRAFGQGYLLNVDKHPHIISAWWPKKKKYQLILDEFFYYENLTKKYSPNLVAGLNRDPILYLVCRHKNIPYLTISPPRIGKHYLWTENPREQNYKLIDSVKSYIKDAHNFSSFLKKELPKTAAKEYFSSKHNYGYSNAIKGMLKQTVVELYQLWKHTHKRYTGGYRFLAWNPSFLRQAANYRYFLKHGVKIDDIKINRIVLFPLHVEPEPSLSVLSPEMNNSIELITWISKSLPADVTLVVKEHPNFFGVRSRQYYNFFMRMPNVVLANPDVSSEEWLNAADVIATITGTMGYEAVYLEKPVLSFGKHQLINELPTVKYADSFDDTKKAVNDLLEIEKDNVLFKISKEALEREQAEYSFDLPCFEKTLYSNELHLDLNRIAINNLYKVYPEVFDGKFGA